MKQRNLLVINTLATYVRMALTIGISLFTIRLLYREMGEVGYGLFTAVVASGSLLSFLNASLVTSAQRHIAFSIGSRDVCGQKAAFSGVWIVFTVAAGVLLAIGLCGSSFIVDRLNVPDERRNAILLAFQTSILNLALTTFFASYRATTQAHQDIVFTTIVELVNRISLLAGVLILPFLRGDVILNYSIVILTVTAFSNLIIARFALNRYAMVTFIPSRLDRKEIRPVCEFAAWQMWASAASAGREKGSVIALNCFFGPAVNASYALSQQLMNYVIQVASSINRVISPAATTTEGRGNSEKLEEYASIGSRYPVFVAMLIGAPIVLDGELLMQIWLGKSPPVYALEFLMLNFAIRFSGLMSWGEDIAAQAKGRIAVLSIASSIPFLLALAVVCLSFELGLIGPLALPLSMLVVTLVICLWFKPWWVGKMLRRPWIAYLRDVPVRTVFTAFPAVLVACIFRLQIPEIWWRPLVLGIVFASILLPSIWIFGLHAWERKAWREMAARWIERLRSIGNTSIGNV